MEIIENLRKSAANGKHGGILYPVMLIAALAVIILSVLGVATITGYLPKALSKGEAVTTQSAAKGSEPLSVQAPAPSAPVKRSGRPEARTAAPVAVQRCSTC